MTLPLFARYGESSVDSSGDNHIDVYGYVTELASFSSNSIQNDLLTRLFPYDQTWPRNVDNRTPDHVLQK